MEARFQDRGIVLVRSVEDIDCYLGQVRKAAAEAHA